MKKKNGFIATSLIYSFFLVFIAIMAALLNNFISNKTILERFNDDVQASLNNDTFNVTIFSKNSNIHEGFTISNLISDGEFKNFQSHWNKLGNATYNFTSYNSKNALLKKNNSSQSYLYQNISIEQNNKYYFSINHYQNFTNPVLKTYIDNKDISVDTCNSITNPCTYNGWVKSSKIYNSLKKADVNFVVGNSETNYTNNSYFTEALVINITAAFGSGKEPTKEWLDANIDYFEGTMNYINLEKIQNGENVIIKFSPYNEFKNYSIKCSPNIDYKMNKEEIDGREYGTLELKSIKNDIICHVDWSK